MAARHRRFDLARGRRHRDHEHPVGLGHGTDARDRAAHGDRRAPRAHTVPVPGRSGAAGGDRRRRRNHLRCRRIPRHLGRRRLADARFTRGHRGRILVLRRGRDLLRLLSGAQSGASRSRSKRCGTSSHDSIPFHARAARRPACHHRVGVGLRGGSGFPAAQIAHPRRLHRDGDLHLAGGRRRGAATPGGRPRRGAGMVEAVPLARARSGDVPRHRGQPHAGGGPGDARRRAASRSRSPPAHSSPPSIWRRTPAGRDRAARAPVRRPLRRAAARSRTVFPWVLS